MIKIERLNDSGRVRSDLSSCLKFEEIVKDEGANILVTRNTFTFGAADRTEATLLSSVTF